MKRRPEVLIKIVDSESGGKASPSEVPRPRWDPPVRPVSACPMPTLETFLKSWLSHGQIDSWHRWHNLQASPDGFDKCVDLIVDHVRMIGSVTHLTFSYEGLRRTLRHGIAARMSKIGGALQKLAEVTDDLCPQGLPLQARVTCLTSAMGSVEEEARTLLKSISDVQASYARMKALMEQSDGTMQIRSLSNEFIHYMVAVFYLTGSRPGKSNRGPFVEFVAAAWRDFGWDVPPKNADDIEGWLGEQINKHPVVKAAEDVTPQRVEEAFQLLEDIRAAVTEAESGP